MDRDCFRENVNYIAEYGLDVNIQPKKNYKKIDIKEEREFEIRHAHFLETEVIPPLKKEIAELKRLRKNESNPAKRGAYTRKINQKELDLKLNKRTINLYKEG